MAMIRARVQRKAGGNQILVGRIVKYSMQNLYGRGRVCMVANHDHRLRRGGIGWIQVHSDSLQEAKIGGHSQSARTHSRDSRGGIQTGTTQEDTEENDRTKKSRGQRHRSKARKAAKKREEQWGVCSSRPTTGSSEETQS